MTVPDARPQRERKAVEVLNVGKTEAKKPGPTRQQGDGVALRDIEATKAALKKVKPDDDLLKLLHRAMYGTEGKHHQRKGQVLGFSGLKGGSASETSEIVAQASRVVTGFKQADLVRVLALFDLPRGQKEDGSKEARVERLVAFLTKPVDSGKPAGSATAKAAKPRKSGSRKKADAEEEEEEEAEDADEPAAAKAAKPKAKRPRAKAAGSGDAVPKAKAPKKAKAPSKKSKKADAADNTNGAADGSAAEAADDVSPADVAAEPAAAAEPAPEPATAAV